VVNGSEWLPSSVDSLTPLHGHLTSRNGNVRFFFCFVLFFCFFFFVCLFWFFETGFLCIALAVLELTL
jgi:hypothetical protein